MFSISLLFSVETTLSRLPQQCCMEITHFQVTTDLQSAKFSGQFSISILLGLSAAFDTGESLFRIPWALKPHDVLPILLTVLS